MIAVGGWSCWASAFSVLFYCSVNRTTTEQIIEFSLVSWKSNRWPSDLNADLDSTMLMFKDVYNVIFIYLITVLRSNGMSKFWYSDDEMECRKFETWHVPARRLAWVCSENIFICFLWCEPRSLSALHHDDGERQLKVCVAQSLLEEPLRGLSVTQEVPSSSTLGRL